MENLLPDIANIGQVIQLAVAPVFLLAGISGLLGVMTNRLGRIIDRSRILQRGIESIDDGEAEKTIKKEMHKLGKRANFINISINLATCSALVVCLVIISLFLSQLTNINFSNAIAVLFILCMTLLIIALWMFLLEVFIATHTMRKGLIRSETLILNLTRGDDS